MSDPERSPIDGNEMEDSRRLILTHLHFVRRSGTQEQALDPGLYIAVGPLSPEEQENPPEVLFEVVEETISGLFFSRPLPDEGGSTHDYCLGLDIKHLGNWDDVNGILLRVRFDSEKKSLEYASLVFPDF